MRATTLVENNEGICPYREEVPNWLTLETLSKSVPIKHFGYREMWPDVLWSMNRDDCFEWEMHLTEVMQKCPDNHVTFLIRMPNETSLYAMFHDHLVLLGTDALAD